jgi:hypothetical protein
MMLLSIQTSPSLSRQAGSRTIGTRRKTRLDEQRDNLLALLGGALRPPAGLDALDEVLDRLEPAATPAVFVEEPFDLGDREAE